MKNVLVIGGSGFLGSHTADELTRRGYHVSLFDESESQWRTPEQVMHVGNVLDKNALDAVLDGIDVVYHFAGIADINESAERPFDTININVSGTAQIIDAAVCARVQRFIYASTVYVFSPFGSFYRASKQAAETIIEAYNEQFDLDYTVLRYGSLYGPRAQDWNGLRAYVKQIIQSDRLDYDGDGQERREYIHALDAARLSVDILDEKYRNQAITITGTQSMSSTELFQMIFEIAGKKPVVNYEVGNRSQFHYGLTPYRYTPRQSTKLIPNEFVDLGQGILEIVEEVHRENEG
jgi:UDP-glucose 4-epimerase